MDTSVLFNIRPPYIVIQKQLNGCNGWPQTIRTADIHNCQLAIAANIEMESDYEQKRRQYLEVRQLFTSS
jgi:hypothetical protein